MASSPYLWYLLGAGMIGFGIFTVGHRAFPGWVKGIALWPLVNVTPAVAIMQGWAAVAVGVAVLVYAFAPFIAHGLRTGSSLLALGSAGASLVLVVYSTWLSRRPPAGAVPPSR